MPTDASSPATFRPETLQTLFKSVWKDPNTKASKDALALSAEFLRLFVIESFSHAAHQAKLEAPASSKIDSNSMMVDEDNEGGDGEGKEPIPVKVEHLEKVITQVLLDF
ncbi:hypothetical protein HDV00_006710 [Rhizophlyctis rosea]|nr:hypothetical protein HDV00_006710 [Rhizophlyctis rosea]